jgi:hypothetical protein
MGKKKKITMADQEGMTTCKMVMELGPRCWACAKNQFASNTRPQETFASIKFDFTKNDAVNFGAIWALY